MEKEFGGHYYPVTPQTKDYNVKTDGDELLSKVNPLQVNRLDIIVA